MVVSKGRLASYAGTRDSQRGSPSSPQPVLATCLWPCPPSFPSAGPPLLWVGARPWELHPFPPVDSLPFCPPPRSGFLLLAFTNAQVCPLKTFLNLTSTSSSPPLLHNRSSQPSCLHFFTSHSFLNPSQSPFSAAPPSTMKQPLLQLPETSCHQIQKAFSNQSSSACEDVSLPETLPCPPGL